MNRYSFHVSGTHCPACKILIEDILSRRTEIEQVTVDLRHRQVTIASAGESTLEAWSATLQPHGYRLSSEKSGKSPSSFLLPILLGVGVLVIFFLIQKAGIFSFDSSRPLTAPTALAVGVVASLSSCLAVVGGLVLSLSAQMSRDSSSFRPLLAFHAGRVIGFFLLGGVLGLAGEAMSISFTVSAALGMLAAAVMILLGLNLLGIFNAMQYLSLPRGMFDRVARIETGTAAPFLVGAATFFLPCGFTQAMQVAALASGSPLGGSMIMGMFALGTLPVLGLLSFGSFSLAHTASARIFLQTVGVVVIGFGLFSLLTGLAAFGIIPPLLTL
jgi:sulfite exporter TauE/SafE